MAVLGALDAKAIEADVFACGGAVAVGVATDARSCGIAHRSGGIGGTVCVGFALDALGVDAVLAAWALVVGAASDFAQRVGAVADITATAICIGLASDTFAFRGITHAAHGPCVKRGTLGVCVASTAIACDTSRANTEEIVAITLTIGALNTHHTLRRRWCGSTSQRTAATLQTDRICTTTRLRSAIGRAIRCVDTVLCASARRDTHAVLAVVVGSAIGVATAAHDAFRLLCVADLVGGAIAIATASDNALAGRTDLTRAAIRVLRTLNTDIVLTLAVVRAVGVGQTLDAFFRGGVAELSCGRGRALSVVDAIGLGFADVGGGVADLACAAMSVGRTDHTLFLGNFAVGCGGSTLVVRRTSDKDALVGLAIELNLAICFGLAFNAGIVDTSGLAWIGFTVRIDHTESCFEFAGFGSCIALLIRQAIGTCDTRITLSVGNVADLLGGIGGTVGVGTTTCGRCALVLDTNGARWIFAIGVGLALGGRLNALACCSITLGFGGFVCAIGVAGTLGGSGYTDASGDITNRLGGIDFAVIIGATAAFGCANAVGFADFVGGTIGIALTRFCQRLTSPCFAIRPKATAISARSAVGHVRLQIHANAVAIGLSVLARCHGFTSTRFALGANATRLTACAAVGKIGLCVHAFVSAKRLAVWTSLASSRSRVAQRLGRVGTIGIGGAFALHRLDALAGGCVARSTRGFAYAIRIGLTFGGLFVYALAILTNSVGVVAIGIHLTLRRDGFAKTIVAAGLIGWTIAVFAALSFVHGGLFRIATVSCCFGLSFGLRRIFWAACLCHQQDPQRSNSQTALEKFPRL